MVYYLVRLSDGYVAIVTRSLALAFDIARGYPEATLEQEVR